MLFAVLLSMSFIHAQESDSIPASQKSSSPGLLKKITISGLIQSQYQAFGSEASRSFGMNTNDRFTIRRGRLRIIFNSAIAGYVFQVRATERGMGVDEVYLAVTEPWLKSFTLTSGIFNRPFGNEISYAASQLESDERSRIIKTLFPLEKDLGAMITFRPQSTSLLNFLTIDAGIFNGTGPNAEDFDNRKNFIGHIHGKKALQNNRIQMGLGASWYKGGFSNQRSFHYVWDNGFRACPNDTLALSKQDIIGMDAQFAVKWLPGETRLRMEYLTGVQSGTWESSISPAAAPADEHGNPLPSFQRPVEGGYVFIIQEVPKTKVQLVFKYDWYDPNTHAKGVDIGLLNNTGPADIMYHTYGMGVNYLFNRNFLFMVYANLIRNEKTSMPEYATDLDDNALTLRVQYVF